MRVLLVILIGAPLLIAFLMLILTLYTMYPFIKHDILSLLGLLN
jgi:hypothetical protein